MSLFKDTTILIVTFKSEKIIFKTLKNISKKFKILIAENSNNVILKKKIEKKYLNCKVFNTGKNLGVSKAINFLLKKVNTKYSIFITPDAFPAKDCFDKLYNVAKKINNAAILSPNNKLEKEKKLYGFYNSKEKNINSSNDIINVDWVLGGVMFFNNNHLKKIGYFDENFFLDYEEIDLCLRAKKNFFNVLFCKKIFTYNLKHQSSDQNYFMLKKLRAWHHGWSMHYFYKKHFILKKYLKFPLLILVTTIVKFFYQLTRLDTNKMTIHLFFINGFLNSLLKKKSNFRI